MYTCENTTCGKAHSSTRRSVCKACYDATQSSSADGSTAAGNTDIPGLPADMVENLPELPENWVNEPLATLNGGHILKIILLGNDAINNKLIALGARVDALEQSIELKDQKITKNAETVASAEARIVALEKDNATLKKVILNQQTFVEQTQRSNLARNAMITGIPDTPLTIEGFVMNTTEEKVHGILDELNPDIKSEHYVIKVFDPFTNARGVITHSAKIIFKTQELKKKTMEKTKMFKEHENAFFQSVYVRNDETKLSRSENYRIRKKARELRESNPNDKTIKIEKGVLYQNGSEIDHFDLSNQIFC